VGGLVDSPGEPGMNAVAASLALWDRDIEALGPISVNIAYTEAGVRASRFCEIVLLPDYGEPEDDCPRVSAPTFFEAVEAAAALKAEFGWEQFCGRSH